MAALIREFDWTSTPLGAPVGWSANLNLLVELMLGSEQPMFLVWGTGRTLLYNDAFIAIAGRKHPGALGASFDQVWAEAWDELGPIVDRALAGEAIHINDIKLQLDRNDVLEEAHFDFSYTPVRGEHAHVQGLFGVCSETTGRVLSERHQLAASQNQRGRLFDMSRDLFAVASFDGYLKSINPSWSRQLQRNDADLLARPFAEIIHPDDLGTTADVVARLQRGEAVHQFHVRLLKADGMPISFAWSAVPEQEGDSGDFYTVGRDITEDEQREDVLRQGQKMEAMGQLTGGLAHDFNNLLQAVHGNLDLIRRKPDDAARVHRWAENAIQAAERGSKLTSQLLAFSRAQKLELRPISIASLVAAMEDMLRGALGPMVELSTDPGNGELGALADPTQLELALLNLAINARDAMPAGGAVTITAKPVTIAADPELASGRYVEIRVADTGTGMTTEVAGRAFDPFFTTKATGKGTGLGLSQVYGMARQAHGIARIETNAAHGTTIVLLLQRTVVAREEEAADTVATAPLHAPAMRVLVIDDDADVRLFLAEALEALGFTVLVAADGEQGLAMLAQASPDLLLIDFAMPGLTGAEVANRARAAHPDLPIVFASGYSDTAAIEAAVGRSAIPLRKPFAIAELDAVIRAAVAP